MTIGKMETVLAELNEGSQDIQKTIAEILLRSNSRLDIKKELEKLANDLTTSRKNQELAEKFTQGVLDWAQKIQIQRFTSSSKHISNPKKDR